MKHVKDIDINGLRGRESIKLKLEHIDKYIKGKTILVTGGGGSIGSEIVKLVEDKVLTYMRKECAIAN